MPIEVAPGELAHFDVPANAVGLYLYVDRIVGVLAHRYRGDAARHSWHPALTDMNSKSAISVNSALVNHTLATSLLSMAASATK